MSVPFPQQLLNAQLLFSTAFMEGVESIKDNVDTVWKQKTTVIPMAGHRTTVLGFLAEQPQFRLWQGEREVKDLKVAAYTISTDKYEYSYRLSRDDVKFDTFGLLAMHPKGAGRASKMFYEKLVNAAQQAGTTRTCVDGQYFYDTDHPSGLDGTGPTFGNYRTGCTLNIANVFSGYAIMAQLVDANGDNFGIRPNVLEYGPGQVEKIRDIFSAELTAKAIATAIGQEVHTVSNTIGGLVTPFLNPNLPAGQWYLHDTRSTLMPFLLGEEEAPTGLEMRVDPLDPHVWDFDEFLFGARARAGADYGLPHTSQRNEE